MDRVNDILSDLELKSRAHPKPTPYTRLNMFCPRFDVRETASAYELHGELPGIVMRDINIEFTEDQTITIRGKIERLYEKDERRLHIPGIDKGVELPKDGEEEVKEVKTREEVSADTARAIAEGGKYWYHERQVGVFDRSFSFPIKVLKEDVEAEMHNGVLSVIVPKWRKPAGRKIRVRAVERSREHSRERGLARGFSREQSRERLSRGVSREQSPVKERNHSWEPAERREVSRERLSQGVSRDRTPERGVENTDDRKTPTKLEKRVSFSDGMHMRVAPPAPEVHTASDDTDYEVQRVPSVLKAGGMGLSRRKPVRPSEKLEREGSRLSGFFRGGVRDG